MDRDFNRGSSGGKRPWGLDVCIYGKDDDWSKGKNTWGASLPGVSVFKMHRLGQI